MLMGRLPRRGWSDCMLMGRPPWRGGLKLVCRKEEHVAAGIDVVLPVPACGCDCGCDLCVDLSLMVSVVRFSWAAYWELCVGSCVGLCVGSRIGTEDGASAQCALDMCWAHNALHVLHVLLGRVQSYTQGHIRVHVCARGTQRGRQRGRQALARKHLHRLGGSCLACSACLAALLACCLPNSSGPRANDWRWKVGILVGIWSAVWGDDSAVHPSSLLLTNALAT